MIDQDRNENYELRAAVVALLSHAIRRQHLPPGLTFDSELWDHLRTVAGESSVAAVTEQINVTHKRLWKAERGAK